MSWVADFLESRRCLLGEQTAGDSWLDSRLRVIWVPSRFGLERFVRELTPRDSGNEDAEAGLAALVDLALKDPHSGYSAPKQASGLDPAGVVAPHLVAARLARLVPPVAREELLLLAHFASFWPEGGPAWRAIAVAAVPRMLARPPEEHDGLFAALIAASSGTLTGVPGTVHGHWSMQVERAAAFGADEPDVGLGAYWEWRLAVARQDLAAEQRRVAEQEWLS